MERNDTAAALGKFGLVAVASLAAASIWATTPPEPSGLLDPRAWAEATPWEPRLGQDYELTLGASRYSLRVENVAKGMHYTIAYGGQSYSYILAPFDATRTAVRAVADLDGDAQPDFVIDVDDATYVLLSTRAQPGANLPTAEFHLEPEGC